MKLYGNYFAHHLLKDGFIAYAVKNAKGTMRYAGRDEFHKIALISGRGKICYHDSVYEIDGSVMLITTPGILCSWELLEQSGQSYVITFSDDFIKKDCADWAEECARYFTMNPVFELRPEEAKFIRSIFCKMIDEETSRYSFKGELVRDQICVISHLAFKKSPVKAVEFAGAKHTYSAPAIRLELLEHQFPGPAQVLHLN